MEEYNGVSKLKKCKLVNGNEIHGSRNRIESKLNFDEWESYLEFTRTLSPTVRALED